jgi:hypothetical protein
LFTPGFIIIKSNKNMLLADNADHPASNQELMLGMQMKGSEDETLFDAKQFYLRGN